MSKIFPYILIPILLLLLPLQVSSELTDIAYSGFVELSQEGHSSEENVDFSRIEIQLLTQDLRLIEKTFCSESGFFLLPINEPRRYVVRVFSQDNFLFEPESRILDLEEKSDVEIKRFIEQTDSSFKFIGFSLRGQLFSQNSKDSLGPKGIKIGLYDFKDKFLSETTSVEGGVFSFDKLQAGNYSIIALENNIEVLGYSLSKNERRMKCEVSWGKPYNCQGRIVIHGYTYKGFVLNEETPLANFFLFLYETTPNNNPNYPCTKPEMKTHPLIQKYPRYLCYSISDQEGAFVFSDLSNGDYILSIKPLQDDKKVEIEPHEVPLVIRHSAKTEKLQFQVNRFSIEGRVVDTQGLGLAHVVISLDGEEKTKTNEKGYYSLEKVRSGTYTLEGLHDHLFFEPIHDLKLSVGLKQIPNLVLTYLHVCGKVLLNFDNLFQESQEAQKLKITIYLENSKQEKRTTFTDGNGQFCFEAKPGNYNIYPVIDKTLNEISFFPQKHSFEITNTPRLDLDFHRPKVSIHGIVNFLPGLSKELREKTKVKISCQQKALIHEIAPNGEFFINNVLSGTYELSIENENLCWEKPSIPLEISQNSNITDLKFHQLGFAMRYEVISTIEADVTLPKGKHEKWSFSPDQSYKCVQEQGDYLIKPDECASYKEETFKYRTYQAEKLSLIPERHLIAGELKFNLSKTSITKELLEKLPTALSQLNYLSIDSFNLDKTTLLENLKVPFVYKKDPQQKEILTFSYRHYVKPFTMNRIIPKTNKLINLDPTLHSLLENLLFYPQIREISISQTCQLHETNFLIKAGLILTGKIFPENITDVNVTIYQDNKAIQTILVRNGSFRAGPFSDHLNYQIEASKMNYRFLQIESHMVENILSFKMVAQRLSVIKVLVQDLEHKPISGVSVFISSTVKNEKLKLNNVTDENGAFISNNLVKGEYMVKCSLKEYSFEPNQKIVKILEGDNTEIVVLGKQITFSIFGKVLRLSQDGLENAIVEIFEDNKIKDSVKTNNLGGFRIRALEPFKTYQISLKKQENLHYFKPKVLNVEMKNHDVSNLEFIVFEKRVKYSLMGTIEFDEKFTREEIEDFQSFEIEIYEFQDQQTPLNEVRKLFVNRYFEFEELPVKEYVVKLIYKRTKNSLTQELLKIYNLEELQENEFQMHKKIVIPKIFQENKKGQSQSFSLLGPAVLLVLLIALLNLDTTKEIVGRIMEILKKK